MRLVERDTFTTEQWKAIVGQEQEPWGGGPAESMTWCEGKRYLVALDDSGGGEPEAVIGVLVAAVEAGGERFDVVGVGSLIVAESRRRQGLGGQLLERGLELAGQMGPERAMLFCEDALVARYSRYGFELIEGPVFAEQPDGRIEMPMNSMWRPLCEGARWPPGRVDVLGLPF